LPAPTPGRRQEEGGFRVSVVGASQAKLMWRPFSIPCGMNHKSDAPLLLDTAAAVAAGAAPAAVLADYEVVVRSADSAVLASAHREAVASLDLGNGDAEGSQYGWIEAELPFEPSCSCTFEVRARLRRGAWGPCLKSPALPPQASRSGRRTNPAASAQPVAS